jgi:glycerol-3-phosphate dehydrogenase
METLSADVLVIGGGATGVGVAWDAALRGLDVVLVERHDLAQGTSGRFHGLLHSGGRYVVKDPVAAAECAAENAILRRVAAACIEDTGGLFVTTPHDDAGYADRFAAACVQAGVPCHEIDTAQALRDEPRLNPRITRAFRVLDANIDVWKTVWALADGARAHGARVMPYHAVVSISREGDAVTGALVRDARSGAEFEINARVTVNATGAWAGQIAQLAGIDDVRVLPGRGIMIAMNHRLVNTVVNRCAMPGDGDILVPIRTVSVIGTTDELTDDPDDQTVRPREVQRMLDDGEKLVPGFRDARALRVWTGVRPLFEETKSAATQAAGAEPGDPQGAPVETRDVTRAHALLDHAERDGVSGLVTITGGKLTTYRLMAEQAVDAACRQLGRDELRCSTATTPLPGSQSGEHFRLSGRLARKEQAPDEQVICECELVTRTQLEQEIASDPGGDLDDLRRRLRLGMGPCQGAFCMYRAAGVMHSCGADALHVNAALRAFAEERRKGVGPVRYSDQLRQSQLDEWIFTGVLDLEGLPR